MQLFRSSSILMILRLTICLCGWLLPRISKIKLLMSVEKVSSTKNKLPSMWPSIMVISLYSCSCNVLVASNKWILSSQFRHQIKFSWRSMTNKYPRSFFKGFMLIVLINMVKESIFQTISEGLKRSNWFSYSEKVMVFICNTSKIRHRIWYGCIKLGSSIRIWSFSGLGRRMWRSRIKGQGMGPKMWMLNSILDQVRSICCYFVSRMVSHMSSRAAKEPANSPIYAKRRI